MRLSVLNIFVPLGLALFGVPVSAQGFDTPVPGEPDKLPWRLVADRETAMLFVAVTSRSGAEARLESMAVWKTPVEDDDGFSYDGLAETVAVHCPTKRWRREYFQTALGGAQNPPPMIRAPLAPDGEGAETAFMNAAPPEDSVRHVQLAMACGEVPLPTTQVVNPYRWARQHFGLESPPARRRR
jgi:hypothetical protein